jgi:hypothetical protein
MWKAILAGTTALAIAGSSLVYAQQRDGRPDRMQRGPNMEDMRAFAEARLAGLKAGLTLTPEQERKWPAFEQAARDMQKLRLDRMNSFMAERRNPQPRSSDPADRLRQRGTAMADTGAALKKLADATDPLYKSLDDNQKRRFAILGRMGGGRDDGGGPQFRGRDGGGPEFRGRDRNGPEFRGRDGDGPRGFERGNRRTELAPEGFERGRRGPGRTIGGPAEAEQDL